MAIFKEVVRGDGSGIAEYYRVNDGKVMNVDYSVVTNKPTINGVVLAGDLTMADFTEGLDAAVIPMTGQEMSKLGSSDTGIILCTSDYSYRDNTGKINAVSRGVVYEVVKGRLVDTILVSGSGDGSGGGSGSTPRSNYTVTVSPLEQNVAIGAEAELKFRFETTTLPDSGTAQLYINGKLKSTQSVKTGEYSFDVSKYIKAGVNTFQVVTFDRNNAKITLDYIVNGIELLLSSDFSSKTVQGIDIDFRYKLTGYGNKEIHFALDDEEEIIIESSSSNINTVQQFKNLSHGAHHLEVWADVQMEETYLESNKLVYDFLCADPFNDEVLILSTFNTESATEGDLLAIDYLVYNNKAAKSQVQLLINDEKKLDVEVGRTRQTWNVTNYPIGTTTFSIVCGDVRVDKIVEVAKLNIDLNPVTDNLLLHLTAQNRSNQETEDTRSVWSYGDTTAELNNFTWVGDGWLNSALKFKGLANGYLPINLFEEDIRKTGRTFEFEFETYRAFKASSILLECLTEGKGFQIKQNECTLASEQTSVIAKFNENSRIRVSFVIEPLSSNRLIKTYINGVLSGLAQYSDTDNFQHNAPVGITINPDEEEIDICSIRIYNRDLSSEEVLNNYMYDLSDNAVKIQKYTDNLIYDVNGNVSYIKMKAQMPVLTITGEMPPAKGEKRTVSCVYENIADDTYNFDYDGCTIDVQGTSSQYYPRKNWKITLPEKIKFHENAIEEDTFCFKADYMETSHSHNIGSAIIANNLPTELFPTRQENDKVRDTMYGFPCVIFVKENEEAEPVFHGTYMFNNDKSNADTLGLTTELAESWEFRNNTSDHCLFKTNDFSVAAKPEDNLEARYPGKNTDYTNIKKLYDWIVGCNGDVAKFKAEFEEHLNLEYCLNYIVFMEFAMLTDSRAKNMFLDTVDGNIWYPRFYDMDTAWGLNNEGELRFSYDVEMHDQIGSGYVWNDRGQSVLWNMFEEAFADEIKNKYHELRKEKLTYDNIYETYVTNISDKFVEASYNEDAEYKYVGPLVENGDSTYLYAAQGDRIEHFKYLLENRIIYLDSKYEYGDYNSNYATMRLYTTSADFDITPYTTQYIKIKFGSTLKGTKCAAGQITKITQPPGLEFNDTETIIYGASEIANLGDLRDKYPGTVDITKCGKLQELIIGPTTGKNENLKTLSLGNNPLLRKLDVRNCPNLKGNLDMSGCSDLREVYLTGSGVTSVSLPETSSVQKLHLPASLTSLTLKHQYNITDLQFESYSNIQTLILADSIIGDPEDLIFKCPSLLRLNIEFKAGFFDAMPLDQLLHYTNNLKGVDEQGYNTEHPGFSGELTVSIPGHYTAEEIDNFKTMLASVYPLLNITYVQGADVFQFTGYGKVRTTPSTTYPDGWYWSSTTDESQIEFYLVSKIIDGSEGVITFPETYKGKPVRGTTGLTITKANYKIRAVVSPASYAYSAEPGRTIFKGITAIQGETSASQESKLQIINGIGPSFSLDGMFKHLSSLENQNDVTGTVTFNVYNATPPISGKVFFPNATSYGREGLSHFKDVVWEKAEKIVYQGTYSSTKHANFANGDNAFRLTEQPLIFKESVLTTQMSAFGSSITSVSSGYSAGIRGIQVTNEVDISHFPSNNTIPITTSLRAKKITGTDCIQSTCYNRNGVLLPWRMFGPFISEEDEFLSFPGITKMAYEGDPSLMSTTAKEVFQIVESSLAHYIFPNLKEIDVDYVKGPDVNQTAAEANDDKGFIRIGENVKLTKRTNSITERGACTLIARYGMLCRSLDVPALDCSELDHGGYNTTTIRTSWVVNFGGFKDYGKAFDTTVSANYSKYRLGSFMVAPRLTFESLINILDNLYDIASMGCATQTVYFGTSHLQKLKASEEGLAAIERATEKGWTIVA